jgi:putative Fe(2+)-trafficking protein
VLILIGIGVKGDFSYNKSHLLEKKHNMARMVYCVKLKKEAEGMKFPPFANEIGKRIYDNISQEAWDSWIRLQTMIINENQLNLSDSQARQYLMRQMEQFLFGEDESY